MPDYTYGGYGGYSMHLPPTANTTKIHCIILYTAWPVGRQLDDKPLVWRVGRGDMTVTISSKAGHLYIDKFSNYFYFSEASQN